VTLLLVAAITSREAKLTSKVQQADFFKLQHPADEAIINR
jgi:hypothetical protein